MSISIIPMISRGESNVSISESVIENVTESCLPVVSVNVWPCEYNFANNGVRAAKIITLDVAERFYFGSIVGKIWKFIQKLFQCIGLCAPPQRYNDGDIADCILGIDRKAERDGSMRQASKEIKQIQILISCDKANHLRELFIKRK